MTAIVLDVETTGFSPTRDRVIEIAIMEYETGELLFHTMLNPRMVIPEEIEKLTGVTNAQVMFAPIFDDIAVELQRCISSAEAMIGHNPFFDRGMLAAEFRRLSLSVKWPVLICTKRIWDKHEPREDRHLTNAYKRFVNKNGFEGAHGAVADTRACWEVFKSQVDTFNLQDTSWDQFDPEQTSWWGPSNHILIKDGILVVNFGKHKGTPVHAAEKTYWKWLVTQDFPEHVCMLADYMNIKPEINGEELYSWAYGRIS